MVRHNGRVMVEEFPQTGATESWRERERGDVYDPEQHDREIEQMAYREASERCMRVINASMAHIGARLLTMAGAPVQVLTDFWTVAIAHGSFLCSDRSISEIAHEIGVSRATLSAAAVNFCVGQDLRPSLLMRDPETMAAYRAARLRVVEESQQ